MALLNDRVQIFKAENVLIGEFDLKTEGFYKNVHTFSFDVKKKRAITAIIKADAPVDIAISNDKGSSIAHKQSVKDGELGPVPTGECKEMGLFVGVYPGDKATVSIEVWMEKP